MSTPLSHAALQRLPKTDLHCHLDGSLRLSTLLELMAADPGLIAGRAAVERQLSQGLSRGSLEAYLAVFPHTLAVLQSAETLERVAFELGEDAARENVRWLEVRYCPSLNQAHGLALDDVVSAVERGLRRAHERFGVESGQILCALRDQSPVQSLRLAEFGVRSFRPEEPGAVIGFDLAGAERGHPAIAHAAAFDCARGGNMWVTCHAGEDDGPESIAQAVHRLGVSRIGHAVALAHDPALLRYVADHGIGVEACLSSNVQTGAVADLSAHPLPEFLAARVAVSLATDNRLVSATSVTRELDLAQSALGCGRDAVATILRNGFATAFLSAQRREAYLGELAAALA